MPVPAQIALLVLMVPAMLAITWFVQYRRNPGRRPDWRPRVGMSLAWIALVFSPLLLRAGHTALFAAVILSVPVLAALWVVFVIRENRRR
jgi:hypothetical protein